MTYGSERFQFTQEQVMARVHAEEAQGRREERDRLAEEARVARAAWLKKHQPNFDPIITIGWDDNQMVIMYGDQEIARVDDAGRMDNGEFGAWIAEHIIRYQALESLAIGEDYDHEELELSFKQAKLRLEVAESREWAAAGFRS